MRLFQRVMCVLGLSLLHFCVVFCCYTYSDNRIMARAYQQDDWTDVLNDRLLEVLWFPFIQIISPGTSGALVGWLWLSTSLLWGLIFYGVILLLRRIFRYFLQGTIGVTP